MEQWMKEPQEEDTKACYIVEDDRLRRPAWQLRLEGCGRRCQPSPAPSASLERLLAFLGPTGIEIAIGGPRVPWNWPDCK